MWRHTLGAAAWIVRMKAAKRAMAKATEGVTGEGIEEP